jgi:hypothetical protein
MRRSQHALGPSITDADGGLDNSPTGHIDLKPFDRRVATVRLLASIIMRSGLCHLM